MQALRQVSTLPHRESDGYFLLFLKMQPMRWSRLHLAENNVSHFVAAKQDQRFQTGLTQSDWYHFITYYKKINYKMYFC